MTQKWNKVTGLSGGLRMLPGLFPLAKTGPKFLMSGGVWEDAGVSYMVDQITGKRFVPMAGAPETVVVNGFRTARYAGAQRMKRSDNGDTIVRSNVYSFLSITKTIVGAGRGAPIANDLATANMLAFVTNSNGIFGYRAQFPSTGSWSQAADQRGAWVANLWSYDGTDTANRRFAGYRDGVLDPVSQPTGNFDLATTDGWKRLIIGGDNPATQNFTGSIAVQAYWDEAVHLNADKLATIIAQSAAMVALLNA